MTADARMTCSCGLPTHRVRFDRLCDGCDDLPNACRCPRLIPTVSPWLARRRAGQLPAKEVAA